MKPILYKNPWYLFALLIPLCIAIGVAGYVYYDQQKNNIIRDKKEELSSIADLKSGQIINWRKERSGDAKVILKSPFIAPHFQTYLENQRASVKERTAIIRWMETQMEVYEYDGIILLDKHGTVLMEVPQKAELVGPDAKQLAALAIKNGDMVFSDLYQSKIVEDVRLSLLVPIIARKDDSALPLGVVLLRINPHLFLFPFIQSWPTKSPSAESFLVRREGDNVVFLNELRHKKNTTLTLKRPISEEHLVAAMAARGIEGVVEGVDYRGVPVFAAIKAVPHSPWYLICKIDQDEVKAPVRERFWMVTFVIGLLMMTIGAVFGLIWRHQRSHYYRSLYESEARRLSLIKQYEYLTKYANDIIVLMDKEGKIIEANERAADSYGHSRKELLEMNVGSLRSARASEEGHDIIKRIEDSKEDGKVYTTEHRRRDGTTFPIEVSARAIEIDGEKVFMAIIRDITERMKAENLLKESEERFRRLFETAKDGLLLIEKNTGKIITVNPAIVELLGYSQEEFLGRGIEEVGLLKEMDNFRQITEKLDRDGYICCTDMILETKEGKNIIVDSYLIDKARVIQCNIRDITERKRAEEEREKLESQLFQAQKMEAVGQLAGGIAHDFNNALNVIMGFCTLTQIKMKPDNPCMEYLDEILAATQKAANLTHGLLAFSRKQPVTIKPFNLNQTLSAVGKLLMNFLGEDIHLEMKFSENDIVIKGDSGQIDQVMMNLATNARDSMPDGGTLTISTQLTEIDDEFKRMHGYGEPGIYALIAVEDTGLGMDDETKQRIFEPFFTTKEVGRGTGLGLAIIYGIVKQHNGYIDVYSELGKGTIFRIYLPLAELMAEEALSTQYIPLIGGTETILLVEDEKTLRTVTKDLLERYGYKVIEAEDGIDAVQKFAEHKDTINLVLMDVIMPNKNGKEAYQEILAIRPDAHVIFLSGYASNIITKKMLDKGWELLLKPVPPRELFRKIREVLERGKA